MKKKLKKHELSPPKNSNVKLPKINVSFSDKILTKLNREAYGRKVPNLSHMKMNTKSIYEINKDKTTFNYEFEDKIRKEIKEFRKIRELQSKCNKENEFKSKEERNSNRSIKKTKR